MSVQVKRGLAALVAPGSVAIVGATGKPGSPFSRPLQYLQDYGFTGALYPVNPKYEEIRGLPCYPSLTAIPDAVDLVVVLVPAAHVEQVIVQCAEIGAGAALVLSSGFAETGAEGSAVQQRLVDVARRGNVRLVGPNSQGIIVPSLGLAATFTGAILEALPEPSGLAYVGQSGAVGGCVLDLAGDHGFGLSAWVSVGNQADVNLFEVGRELVESPDIKVIAAYVESVESGTDFVRLAARCAELGKSLVLLRSGRTAVGRRAAVSHTGGLLAPGEAFEAIARRHGAIVVHDVDELVDVSCALLRFGPRHGKRIAVVTASGGAGSIAADQLTLAGLTVDELPAGVQSELAKLIPDFGAVANPVDVTFQLFTAGSAGFAHVCEMLAALDDVDQVVMVMSAIGGDASTRVAQELVGAVNAVDKPVHYAYVVGHQHTAGARAVLRDAKLPAYQSLQRVARVASALSVVPRLSQMPDPVAAAGALADVGAGRLSQAACAELLVAAGVPMPASVLISDATHAPDAVAAVGGRAVLKLQSPDALHKSDDGLVALGVGVETAESIAVNLLKAPSAHAVEGVLVQAQIEAGTELLVGLTRERPDFPLLLTIGLGGVLAEALDDTVSECLPLSASDIEQMLRALRGSALLYGFRGSPPADVAAATVAIVAIASAAEMLGERLAEFEINPLIVGPMGAGAHAVDALARFSAPSGS